MTTATRTQVVYAIGSPQHGMVKIGTTANLPERMASLQTASPFPLVVLWTQEGGTDLERLLHSRLRHHRIHGEWFDFGGEDPVGRITKSLTGNGPSSETGLAGALAFSAQRFHESRSERDALREELAVAIWQADADGVMQKDICDATGYTRQQVRRIVMAGDSDA